MESIVKISKIHHLLLGENYTIKIYFEYSNNLKPYFNINFFELSIKNKFKEPVSDAIAVIPFICNVLPLIWLTNSKLIIDEIDESFYDSIDEFKKGYVELFPELEFRGEVEVKHFIKSKKFSNSNRSALLFSGGIDAWCSLLRHENENMDLINLHGSLDFPLSTEHQESWNFQYHLLKKGAETINKELIIIDTNFSELLNLWEDPIKKLICKNRTLTWWHDFQHGIGIIGHAAVLSAIANYDCIYIASSYHESQKIVCASSPLIDNKVKFLNTQVIHDGYELTRQQKTRYICENLGERKIDLHVCLRSNHLNNCCYCEKCLRTIFSIYVEGYNPQDFGFQFSKKDINSMLRKFDWYIYLNDYNKLFWRDIKKRAIENEQNIINKNILKYFKYKFNIDKHNTLLIKKLVITIQKARKRLRI